MAVSPTARNHAHQQSGTTRVSRAKAGSEKQVEIANGELGGAVPDQMVRPNAANTLPLPPSKAVCSPWPCA